MSKFSDITLDPIEIPAVPSAEWMAPYRKLATAVIVNAVKDLIPLRAKNRVADDQMRQQRDRASAETFLSGESTGGVDLALWCEIADIEPRFIEDAMRDDGGIKMLRLSRQLALQRGRTRDR